MLPTISRGGTLPSIWNDLFNPRRDFDRVFDITFGGPPTSVWSPAVDVSETEDALHLSVELPGLSPDDVEVSVENGVLTISGEKKDEFDEKSEDGTRRVVERRYGRFTRSFSLPRELDAEKVNASFENGVLNVNLVKAESAKPRKIKIKG